MRIAMLNGPNLDRLGEREPETYGTTSWAELTAMCRDWAAELDVELEIHQVDGEGDLVRLVHECGERSDAVVINPAAYTHTSVALRDALLMVPVPVVELHLTLPAGRESFRRRNLISDVVTATVQGFGPTGYRLALTGAAALSAARGGDGP